MKKITLVGVLAGLCLLVNAQKNIEPLYINDRLPDIEINHLINYKSATAKLSELQTAHSKMVLFDFWLTSCAPCVRKFPELDSLQRQFSNQLQIVLVTMERTERVETFLKNWEVKHNKKFSIPIVTADTLFQKYFREQSKPNYVWLATDNVLMAQTASTFVNATTIEKNIIVMDEEIKKRGYLKKDLNLK